MATSEKIIEYLAQEKQVTPKELLDYLNISPPALYKQLKNLLNQGRIVKIGKSPKVYYQIADNKEPSVSGAFLDRDVLEILQKNYLFITPQGERLEGIAGFQSWCEKNNLPVEKTAKEYVKTLEKYQAFKKYGLIDGRQKFSSTFSAVHLDQIFYLDFYSIERFGKTKLGQILLYAKQNQDKKLMRELSYDIAPAISELLKKERIEAVGFIPPTVKREVQFMKELERNLNLPLRKLSLVKVKSDIIIPQKTLTKLEDRIANIQKTLVVDDKGKYGTVLLIDDAVGSGATLEETAAQIKAKGIAERVIGLAITGSFKGFDVISEV